ncbi:hypothetical protein ACFWYW_46620 [Nonomuraea sp. NPDC059023]|uniref:hypothetical protein n=1 Tax=unclassified Nonomuraea TaxID=2593643 RepID=UPI003680968C
MDLSDLFAGLGAATGTAALVVSIWSARSARRSAVEAGKLRQIEADRRGDEISAQHDGLAPPHPGAIDGFLRPNEGDQDLWGTISFPRGYRVRAETWSGRSLSPISLPNVLEPHHAYEFYIENMPNDGTTQPTTQQIRFHLWPPLVGDNVPMWSCPCGVATPEGSMNPGHWELRVPLKYLDTAPRLH